LRRDRGELVATKARQVIREETTARKASGKYALIVDAIMGLKLGEQSVEQGNIDVRRRAGV
jgi:hypothetical protein